MPKTELSMGATVAIAIAAIGTGAADAIAAQSIRATSDLNGLAETTQFIALRHGELHRPETVLAAWDSVAIPKGSSSLDIPLTDPVDFDSYALIGVDNAGGMIVSFSDPEFALGKTFETLFPGFIESEVVSALRTDPFGELIADFASLLDAMPSVGTPVGIQCKCVHLSIAAEYGTFTASIVPGPGPGALALFSGGLALVRRRRTG